MSDSALKEKTSRGLFWGGTSSFLQQLLNAAFGIYLARHLSADDYGMVGALTLFNMLALLLQDGGFFVALVNRREVRKEDYNSVFWFNLFVAIGCYLILFFCAPLIARFFNHPELVAVARWSFLTLVLSGFGTAQKAYLTKRLQIKEISIVNITAVVISGALGIYLAWKGFAYWTLVIQAIVLGVLTNLGFWLFSDWRPNFHIDFVPVKEMFGFSVKLLLTNVMYVINNNVISVILARFYSMDRVGYYTQANKWSSMGSSVLVGMVNSVVQPVMVDVADDRERQLRVLRKMVRFTAFVSFPAMFGLSFIAPEFIIVALTEKWADSIVLLQILCIGCAFAPITSLFAGLVISKGRSTAYLLSHLFLMLTTLSAIYFAYPLGITWMVIITTGINVAWLFVWWMLVRREVSYTLLQLFSDLAPFLGITALSIALAWLTCRPISGMVWVLVAKIGVTALLYVVIMRLSSSVTFKESMQYLTRKLRPGA